MVQNFQSSGGVWYEHFKVYATPAGSTSIGDPVIDLTHSKASGLATGKGLVG